MIKDIYDYGIIGDLYTAALIGKDGSMDWLCLPYLDSPSVFGFLLDADRGGRFAVEPAGPYDSTQTYLRQTNILQTDFRTGEGILRLIDFMPVSEKNENAIKRHEVYRIIEVLKGHATVRVLFEPMFDYAREAARFQTMGDAAIAEEGKHDRLIRAIDYRYLRDGTSADNAASKPTIGGKNHGSAGKTERQKKRSGLQGPQRSPGGNGAGNRGSEELGHSRTRQKGGG